MAGACVYEEKAVIHELTRGLQLAEQLRVNLYSPQTSEILIQKILTTYDNVIFLLQLGDSAGQPPTPSPPASLISIGSPGSEEFAFDQPFSGQQDQNVISKKRKGSTIWEDEFRICSDNGLEGNADDGYHWRKYGQKHILGAKFPRSYYRCSYSKVQNCSATKQVQRSNENPTLFDITYRGKHTCNLGDLASSPPPPPPSLDAQSASQLLAPSLSAQLASTPPPPSLGAQSASQLLAPSFSAQLASPPPPPSLGAQWASPPPSPKNHEMPPTHHQLSPDEMLSNLRANLSVDTSDLGGDISFSFPSTSSGIMEDLDQFQFPTHYADDLWPVYSPPFISPATSESNFFAEWGSSSSLDLLAGPSDVDSDFEFINSLF